MERLKEIGENYKKNCWRGDKEFVRMKMMEFNN